MWESFDPNFQTQTIYFFSFLANLPAHFQERKEDRKYAFNKKLEDG